MLLVLAQQVTIMQQLVTLMDYKQRVLKTLLLVMLQVLHNT